MREATFSAVEYSCALEWWMGDSRSLMFPGSPSRTGLLCFVCRGCHNESIITTRHTDHLREELRIEQVRTACGRHPVAPASRLPRSCASLVAGPSAGPSAGLAPHAQPRPQLPSETAAGLSADAAAAPTSGPHSCEPASQHVAAQASRSAHLDVDALHDDLPHLGHHLQGAHIKCVTSTLPLRWADDLRSDRGLSDAGAGRARLQWGGDWEAGWLASTLTLVTLPTLPLSWPLMTFTVSPVRMGIGSRTGFPFLVSS